MHCINVEENFECLIENYRELEEFIFGETLDHVMARSKAYDDSKFPERTIGRKLANFLSSVRLYCSTIETHASAIVGNQSGATQIDAAMARQFDSSQNYRVMDGLRNYAQHSALPVHSSMLEAKWTPDGNFRDYQFDALIVVSHLAADPKFRKKTKEEIAGELTLKLKPMARDYVECLSTIHADFRKLTNAAVDKLCATIAEAQERLAVSFPDSTGYGLEMWEADSKGNRIGKYKSVTKKRADYLALLRTKNHQLVKFAALRIVY